MTVDKLKPCPFCGGEGKQMAHNRVVCLQCGASSGHIDKGGPGFLPWLGPEPGRRDWNRRAALKAKPAATQGEVEAVARAIYHAMDQGGCVPGEEYCKLNWHYRGHLESLAEAAIAAMPKAHPAHDEQPDIEELKVEVERWKEQAFRPLGDNHHNATLCLYCSPKRVECASTKLTEEEKAESVELTARTIHDARRKFHEMPLWESDLEELRVRYRSYAKAAVTALLERFDLTRKP